MRRYTHFAVSAIALISIPVTSLANIWADSIGQQWFYEVRTTANETLAGTWWEASLEPGKTYNISFDITSLNGKIGLFVGDLPVISISKTGSQSFDFAVTSGGKRRMIFRTLSTNVVAAVSKISVTERLPTADSGPARGHYLSFSRERNLKAEVLNVLDYPTGKTNYQKKIAREIDAALTTPGVRGFAITIDWRTIETGDGVFNWKLIDDNAAAAQRYGLSFVVKVLDRSFDGSNIMPTYFPSKYVLWTTGNGTSGFIAKRWEPYVYTRIIRLYKAIANRYRSNPAFGGIATTESAVGNFSDGGYTVAKYKAALVQIVTQTQAAMTHGRLFWYINFIKGGASKDMNDDERVELVSQVPHHALGIGGPDITPDVQGMPGSVNSYRVHVRKTMPTVSQFCHAQHVDLGLGGRNTKNNQHRRTFLDHIATVRANESKPGFNGIPAVFELDDLDPSAATAFLHPNWRVGQPWLPEELFKFARQNFACDYFFWNYRPPAGQYSEQFTWPDIEPIIKGSQYFYLWY